MNEKDLMLTDLDYAIGDRRTEDCLKCLRDYAARMSRDELGQLSGEALRQYIENLNREKSRRKE